MKVAVVVGTRPEIVKMAPVVRACLKRRVQCVLIHSGQHYSYAMDGVFFRELGLRKPQFNLRVGSGSHAFQIGEIAKRIEPVLMKTRPDVVLVEGDTNTVVAAGITAAKLGIAVGHVEAGLRSYDRRMPEELNRILTDHLADVLFAPTKESKAILVREGIAARRVHVTGNTVVDELMLQRAIARRRVKLARFGVAPRRYAVATVHRPENTNDPATLRRIFEGIAAAGRALGIPVLAPLHPRTSERLRGLRAPLGDAIRVLPPLGYHQFLALQSSAALVLTDSGGVQEEACCLGVPCVTLRENTERPESVAVGANVLAGNDPRRIVRCAAAMVRKRGAWKNPFGDGKAGLRIVDLLRKGSGLFS